jgi:hypothetical protein
MIVSLFNDILSAEYVVQSRVRCEHDDKWRERIKGNAITAYVRHHPTFPSMEQHNH